MTPMLEIKGVDTLVLYGSRARYAAKVDGIVTLKPVGDHDVAVRIPRRATSLTMNAGETLSLTVAAGDVIEIV